MQLLKQRWSLAHAAVIFVSFVLLSHYVPYRRPFSVIALSLLTVVTALTWLCTRLSFPFRALAVLGTLGCYMPLSAYLCLKSAGHLVPLSVYLAVCVCGQCLGLWKLALDRSLAQLFLVQSLAFWFVAQMTLYLDSSGVVFPATGWTGGAMSARLLFWPPLLIVAIGAIGTLSPWRRLYSALVLAGLAQIGNGLIDLWGEVRAPWLEWVSISLWVVFLGGLITVAGGALRSSKRRANTPAPPLSI
jgi:hypothetical protein